jgi:hypothetical protein
MTQAHTEAARHKVKHKTKSVRSIKTIVVSSLRATDPNRTKIGAELQRLS